MYSTPFLSVLSWPCLRLTQTMDVAEEEDTQRTFQKSSNYLSTLPNAANVEEEADAFFASIKDGLTKSVLMLDIKQGAKFWAQQLHR